jgi:hypothetical protein
MGITVLAFLAANAAGVAVTTIRSTFRRTRSAVSSGRRSFFPLRKPVLVKDGKRLQKSTSAIPTRINGVAQITSCWLESATPWKHRGNRLGRISGVVELMGSRLALRQSVIARPGPKRPSKISGQGPGTYLFAKRCWGGLSRFSGGEVSCLPSIQCKPGVAEVAMSMLFARSSGPELIPELH